MTFEKGSPLRLRERGARRDGEPTDAREPRGAVDQGLGEGESADQAAPAPEPANDARDARGAGEPLGTDHDRQHDHGLRGELLSSSSPGGRRSYGVLLLKDEFFGT